MPIETEELKREIFAAYGSVEVNQYLGVANKPYLVHYDYLFNYN